MATKKATAKTAKKATIKAKTAGGASSRAKSAPSKKSAAKPAAKKAAPKSASKPAPKPAKAKVKAAPKSPAKTKAKAPTKPAAKPTVKPAAKGKVAPAKVMPKKKLNVGQKPRSEKSDLSMKPQSFAPVTREPDNAVTSAKATPASKEAKQTFRVNDFVVYPAHGVGRIVGIEKQVIAGITNELFVLDFEQEKLKLKVPTAKAISSGMRALSDDTLVKKAVDVLKGRARIKRTMWSRRAQEYEAKINSGDILSVAEVVRDLYRASDQPEQSYSERQLFEAALDRLAREVAAVRKNDMTKALAELDASLQQKKAA